MRLLEQMKQSVTVKPAAAAQVYQEDDRLYRFDDAGAVALRAVFQPLDEKTNAEVYGQTQQAQLLMLYDGDETLQAGMGVCVDVSADAACDYRIAEMPRRYPGHLESILVWIPEDQRA